MGFLEVLLWDLHSLQVVLALEWILGLRSLFQNFADPSSIGNIQFSSLFALSLLSH